MMGNNDKPQDEFFYSFNLGDIVPEDHLLRSIDRFLDLSDLREHLAPFYSHTGLRAKLPHLETTGRTSHTPDQARFFFGNNNP